MSFNHMYNFQFRFKNKQAVAEVVPSSRLVLLRGSKVEVKSS